MAKILILALALVVAAFTAGCAASVIASNSASNAHCLDQNGNGFVDRGEVIAVIGAYLDQTPIGTLCPDPAPEPTGTVGHSLENPYPVGSTMAGSDGTETKVKAINGDAWEVIQEENQFNDPPADGNRFYMVTLEVANVSGASPLTVSDFDFELVGDNRVVYKTYQHSCGVIPDDLSGEMYPGGMVEGNVCFEVGAEEGGFVLVHAPGFDDENKRYLSLE